MSERIARAKELLATVRHASMATVNEDSSPHNTPYFFIYDELLRHLYWGSHPSSQHSKNIERTGQIFVVLYDGNVKGGLYFEAARAREAKGEELDAAVSAHNAARARFGKIPPVQRIYYEKGEQKMYVADVQHMWVNSVERDAEGEHVRDFRVPITAKDLLG